MKTNNEILSEAIKARTVLYEIGLISDVDFDNIQRRMEVRIAKSERDGQMSDRLLGAINQNQ